MQLITMVDLIFKRPNELLLTTLSWGAYSSDEIITKDLIMLPLTVINNSSEAKSIQLAMVVKHGLQYSAFTNDMESDTMSYGVKGRFQDEMKTNYATGYTLNPKSGKTKFVFFTGATDYHSTPFTEKANEPVDIYVLYREEMKWKPAFIIKWQTPPEKYLTYIKKGLVFGATRFAFKYPENTEINFDIPEDLTNEDK